eukprot:g20535.t1
MRFGHLRWEWPECRSSFAVTDIQVQQPTKNSIPVDITVLIKKAPLSTPLAQPGPAAAPDAGGHFASPQVTEHRMHILSGATPAPSPQKSGMMWFGVIATIADPVNRKDQLRRFL